MQLIIFWATGGFGVLVLEIKFLTALIQVSQSPLAPFLLVCILRKACLDCTRFRMARGLVLLIRIVHQLAYSGRHRRVWTDARMSKSEDLQTKYRTYLTQRITVRSHLNTLIFGEISHIKSTKACLKRLEDTAQTYYHMRTIELQK